MKRFTLAMTGLLAVAALSAAATQDLGETPMSPEQIKEMQAYQQAAMLGPKQAEMAKGVGTWDAVVEFWRKNDGKDWKMMQITYTRAK